MEHECWYSSKRNGQETDKSLPRQMYGGSLNLSNFYIYVHLKNIFANIKMIQQSIILLPLFTAMKAKLFRLGMTSSKICMRGQNS